MNKLSINTYKDCFHIGDHIKDTIFGIGVTAFMRITPGLFLNNKFKIICYKKSVDLEILKQYSDIFCLQEIDKIKLIKLNTPHILQETHTTKYIKDHKGKYILVYKNNKETENVAKKMGLKIVAPKAEIRDIFENKKEFRNIIKNIGIEPIYGENISLKQFIKKEYATIEKLYGKKMVIQLPDIKSGGGLGTFFINNKNEFSFFQKKIQSGSYKNTTIKTINITKFIKGISSSIIGCATKYGTFSSSIQTQLTDIPEVINFKKGSGLFCGHDRSLHHFSKNIESQASAMVEKIGEYMYTKGYKGIFGLDLLIDKKEEKVYVVECNARYTGAFPMISLLDIKASVPPMDIFHILENTNTEYTVDFEKTNKQYKHKKEGSHIILSNKLDKEIVCKKSLKAGVYTYQDDKIIYIRPGLGYNDIKTKNEFIIIDGNPKKGEKIRAFDELSRFAHLLFPGKIALSSNKLNKRTKNIIENIYKNYLD